MQSSPNQSTATATSLRDQVQSARGLLVIERRDLARLVGMHRLKPSPRGDGAGVKRLQTLLRSAHLGLLPFGDDSERLGGRVNEQVHGDGLFGELLASLSEHDQVALFDKDSDLGRVLMLAGDPGDDYQPIARLLIDSFSIGTDRSLSGIRASVVDNGGFAVVRCDDLLESLSTDSRDPQLIEGLFQESGLVPLPVRAVRTDNLVLCAAMDVVLAMRPDDLVGVCLPISTGETQALSVILIAAACRGVDVEKVGALATASKLLFDTGHHRWSRQSREVVQ